MYLYLSFLRPPPLQAALSAKSVLITPQISNDLRTEPFGGSIDIFYTWVPVNSNASQTKPAKLTTYRGTSSMYKEIPVPLSPLMKDGQYWSLALSVSSGEGYLRIPLDGEQSKLDYPLPVISLPILISSKASKPIKQEKIRRVYTLPIQSDVSTEQKRLTVTEETSSDLDKKIWDSGIGLSSWMVSIFHRSTFASEHTQQLQAILHKSFPVCVLELGAGTGIVSLTLGALRSSLTTEEDVEDRILTTDLLSAMETLENNIEANKKTLVSEHRNAIPKPIVLDWDDLFPSEIQSQSPEGFDLIIMADVTYNASSFPSLIKTLSSAVSYSRSVSGAGKTPLILMGYKERDEEERTLWGMARGAGIEFEKVGEREGAGGAPVEIWIGSVGTDVDKM